MTCDYHYKVRHIAFYRHLCMLQPKVEITLSFALKIYTVYLMQIYMFNLYLQVENCKMLLRKVEGTLFAAKY